MHFKIEMDLITEDLKEIDEVIATLLKLQEANTSGNLIIKAQKIENVGLDQLIENLSQYREVVVQENSKKVQNEERTEIEKILEEMDFQIFQDCRKPMISTSFDMEEEIVFQMDRRMERAERFGMPHYRVSGSMNFVFKSLNSSLETQYQCVYEQLEQLEQYDNEDLPGDSIPKTKQEIREANDEFELYIQTRDLLRKNEIEDCLEELISGDNIPKTKQEISFQIDKRLERVERFKLPYLKASGDSTPKTKQEIDETNDEFEFYIQTRDLLKKNE